MTLSHKEFGASAHWPGTTSDADRETQTLCLSTEGCGYLGEGN